MQSTKYLFFVFHPLASMCTLLVTSCTHSSTLAHAHAHAHIIIHTQWLSVLKNCPSYSPIFFPLILGKYFSSSPFPSLSLTSVLLLLFLNLSCFLSSLNLWNKNKTKQICLIESVPNFFSLWHSVYFCNFFHCARRPKKYLTVPFN